MYVVKDVVFKSNDVLREATLNFTKFQVTVFFQYKMTAFSTFYKYLTLYHPDVALQKLKEDECDTCMKYNVFLEDPSNSLEDKAKVSAALKVKLNQYLLSLIT